MPAFTVSASEIAEKTKKYLRSATKFIRGGAKSRYRFRSASRTSYAPSRAVRRTTGSKRKSRMAEIFICISYACAGLILGGAPLPYSVYPCGTALVLSLTDEKHALFAYAGAAFACIGYGNEAAAFFAVNTLAFFAGVFIATLKVRNSRKLRFLLSCVISVLCGTVIAAVGAFETSYLLHGLSYMISLPAVTACLCSVSPLERKRKTITLGGGFCAAAFLAVYALSFVPHATSSSVFFSPAVFALTLITLFASVSGGSMCGLLIGLILGIAAESASEVHTAMAAGIGGFVAGIFEKNKKTAAVIGFLCTFSAVLTYASRGFSHTFGAAVSALCAGILFIPLSEYIPRIMAKNLFPNHGATVFGARTNTYSDLEKLSRAFSSLSDIVYNVSDKLRYPRDYEIRERVSSVLLSYCSGCAMYGHCYSRKLYIDGGVEDIICTRLASGGLKKSDLPDKYAESCIKLSDIIEKLNEGYAELVSEHFRENNTEILASEYNTMARLIKYTSQKAKTDKTPDGALTERAHSALAAIGVRFSSLEAYGNRMKTVDIHGVGADKFPCSSEELAYYMSEKCGILFGEPEYIGLGEKMTVRLTRKRKLRLEYAKCACAKDGCAVNGDSVNFFESDEHYFYALISDGMGSGRSAALTSRLTSVFIEKLLTTGAHKNVTLELLNNLLLSKNDESFATVDLLEIDLLSGDASFIKAGAAPAYILRASKLYKIASFTPPAGIIRSFNAESTKFTLESGDTVLMLSDGIVQSSDEVPWLCEMLSFDSDDDPAKLAEKVLAKAKKVNLRDDDMTCVAVKVI